MNKHDDRRLGGGSQGVKPVSDGTATEAQGTGGTNEESSQLTLPLPRGNNVMRAEEASEVSRQHVATDEPGANDVERDSRPDEAFVDPGDASLGQRLRAAREQRGWSRGDVSAQLKLPASLIARLEGDNYEGLSQGVFLRGYLISYARLVGIPVDDASHVAEAHMEVAPLVATGTISRSRYLFDRYSVSATYLVLTAIIVVPAVWLATHGGLEQNLARTTPLDPPVSVSTPAHEAPSEALAAHAADPVAPSPLGSEGAQVPPPAPVETTPVIASMTPFTTARAPAPESTPPEIPSAQESAAVGTGTHMLVLKLAQQSWVEVTTADGRKLEYSMLSAGSERSYRSDGVLSVRLGNVQGAQVVSDGTVVDLAPFQRGNVAHLNLFGAGSQGATRVEQ